MPVTQTTERVLYEITGADREEFLQDLVTNDLKKLEGGLVYAALLSPQGKYLADFFLSRRGEALILDVASGLAEALVRRLTMYRLRRAVTITPAERLAVRLGLGVPPEGALADPRHAALGWRLYGATAGAVPEAEWRALRVAHLIPESGIELIPEETYILEAGFERLNGVDFRKGCYVGQEISARMKHKTELRKGLARVAVEGEVECGEPILTADGKPAGQLFTRSGDRAIAYLRLDRAGGEMRAGSAKVRLLTD